VGNDGARLKRGRKYTRESGEKGGNLADAHLE
jgi:hypothetical protein